MSFNRKLKILCLHGYRQDADTFKDKLGGFRKSIKNIAELVFVSAPHIIQDEPTSDAMYGNNIMVETDCIKEGRSWWFNSVNHFHSKKKSELALGFKESVDIINDAFKTMGPFDGILGFSQGACLVSLLCGMKEQNEFQFDFQFVILVSGFPSLVTSHQYLYDKVLTSESLHVIGTGDTCISPETSGALISKFKSPTVVYHEGGHFLPTQSEVRDEYKAFLEKILKNILSETTHSNVV